MNTLSLIQGLRFVDSFFPSGGFAFSSGLEAAVKGGAVHDGKDLARYVEDLLLHGVSKREAIAVAVAHQAATARKLEPALKVDRELERLKIDRDSRLASRQMGRQVMKVAAEQIHDSRLLRDYRTAIEEANAWACFRGHGTDVSRLRLVQAGHGRGLHVSDGTGFCVRRHEAFADRPARSSTAVGSVGAVICGIESSRQTARNVSLVVSCARHLFDATRAVGISVVPVLRVSGS